MVGQDDGANGDEENGAGHEEGDEAALQAKEKTDEETDATDRGKDGREREAFVRSRNSGLCSNRSRCRRFGLDRRGCQGAAASSSLAAWAAVLALSSSPLMG